MLDADLIGLGLVERTSKPDRTPLTDEDIILIKGLGRVTFQPGSWDKRFATDMAVLLELREYRGITDGQRANVERLAHKYRRQITGKK